LPVTHHPLFVILTSLAENILLCGIISAIHFCYFVKISLGDLFLPIFIFSAPGFFHHGQIYPTACPDYTQGSAHGRGR
jgi:hypothetical protein